MFISTKDLDSLQEKVTLSVRTDPRAEMARRLPAFIQPFLTWLTARPAPSVQAKARTPLFFILVASAQTLGGFALSMYVIQSLSAASLPAWILLPVGLLTASSGLGLFQVGIFHHCAHGTVFSTPSRNVTVGRLISALMLFKYFDHYKREHMVHHNANKLFTFEDEFTDFVVNMCNLSSVLNRTELWRRLLLLLVSPVFHSRFLYRRICASLGSPDRRHNLVGIMTWTALILGALAAHMFWAFLVAVVLPVSVLLQVATVFRILCEHRVPEAKIIAGRGRMIVSHGTAGVFAGAPLPPEGLPAGQLVTAWMVWCCNMLTIQLFVRIFVLVGDAPCHDFHHRRPARRWTNYINLRQADVDAGCPDFPINYLETWGLFRAIDENFAALAAAQLTAPRVVMPARGGAVRISPALYGQAG